MECPGVTTACASTGCGGFHSSGNSPITSEFGEGCIWCSVIDCSNLKSARALSRLRQACGGGGGCGGGVSGAIEQLGSESASIPIGPSKHGEGSLCGVRTGDFGDGIRLGLGPRGGLPKPDGPGPEESDGVGGSPLEHAMEQNIAPRRGRKGLPNKLTRQV